MRKSVVLPLVAGCVVAAWFTGVSLWRLFHLDLTMPVHTAPSLLADYRLALITRELDSPFWVEVEAGALRSARQYNVHLEVWGSYGQNEEEFLKRMEIAIASKMDGIIVQGLNTDEFHRLTTVKAGSNGIPVFTVANDVPPGKSIRRTYIGTNHEQAGRMIGRQLLEDMGSSGTVVILRSEREEENQRQRMMGIFDALSPYAGQIRTEIVTTGDTREKVAQAMGNALNRWPDADAFIAVHSANIGAMVRVLEQRFRIDKRYIYAFDDDAEARMLLSQGKISALIVQSPAQMGELSVRLMVQWLKGEKFPLDYNGYFTDFRLVRAGEPL